MEAAQLVIKKYLNETGETKNSLAKKAGVSPHTVQAALEQKNIGVNTLQAILSVMGKSLDIKAA